MPEQERCATTRRCRSDLQRDHQGSGEARRSAEPPRLRRSPGSGVLGALALRARRPAGRPRAEHRPRGRRPPRAGARAEQLALRWLGKTGESRDFTYARPRTRDEPFRRTRSRALGVEQRRPRRACSRGGSQSSTSTALGTLKHRCVFCPLFSAFGPEPIRTRLEHRARAQVLVTTESSTSARSPGIRASLPELEHVILVGEDGAETDVPGTHD